MTEVSFAELRDNLARYPDEVVEGREPIVVTREGGKASVVLISEQEFGGWQETVHLLSSPANAEILLRAIAAAEAGELEEHELIYPAPSPAK